MYFQLLELTYKPEYLKISIAQLIEGEPDGYIGRPLTVSPKSKRYTIVFNGVGNFRSIPEPCWRYEGKENKITGFLSECFESEYSQNLCPCGTGSGSKRHFYVFTESVVIEVIAEYEPEIMVLDPFNPNFR